MIFLRKYSKMKYVFKTFCHLIASFVFFPVFYFFTSCSISSFKKFFTVSCSYSWEKVVFSWTNKNTVFFFFKIYLLIDWLLCWVFVSLLGPSLVAASGGHSSSRCAGLSPSWPLLLRSTGSRCAGSAVVAHGPSCSTARGILPDQGANPCPLH